MASKESKEQMEHQQKDQVQRSNETHSGTPNAVDPNQKRSTEHKSGYVGEGGRTRTSSEERQATDE